MNRHGGFTVRERADGAGRSTHMLTTTIGLMAAFCTTVSYVPQVIKCWTTRETEDISLRMLVMLAAGLVFWVIYGILNGDWVIVLSNIVSLVLLANVLGFKLIEVYGGGQKNRAAGHI